jgi:hypothetical protein
LSTEHSSAHGPNQGGNSTNEEGRPNPKASGAHKAEGVVSPAVLLTEKVVGDDRLNKIRAKVISLHSDVIGNFVETYDTPFGRSFLKSLFEVADVNITA